LVEHVKLSKKILNSFCRTHNN